MARELPTTVQDLLITAYRQTHSIRQSAKIAGASRNAAKRFLRTQGLFPLSTVCRETVGKQSILKSLNFSILEEFFKLGRERLENLEFVAHVKTLAESIANDLCIVRVTDQLKLEMAMYEWISYRKYSFNGLHATSESYESPLKRSHEKLVRAVQIWSDISQKSLCNFLRLLKEIEISNLRLSQAHGNVYINSQINMGK